VWLFASVEKLKIINHKHNIIGNAQCVGQRSCGFFADAIRYIKHTRVLWECSGSAFGL